MSVAKLAISLNSNTLKRLDILVGKHYFPSRSKAIQEAVEEKLVRIDKSRLALECEKLNQVDEQKMAEEGIGSEVKEWEKY
jgi:metal-responsive CopG/Arc/MetJ family transcriptional regulator